MNIIEISLIVLGLSLFETISSIDNAIINGEILSTMSQRARRWFLIWGMLIAVFLVRGFLPLVVLWISNPEMSLLQSVTATFSSDPKVVAAMEKSAPVLLAGGGTFLIFLFFHWLFLEKKNFGIMGEEFIYQHGFWFYAIVSVILTSIVWFAIHKNPMMAFGAVVGSTAFFITHGFKENAEEMEKRMLSGKSDLSDISKLLYLEVIDATFSIDGVLGAFAFTFSVPLILLGNGIGAILVRELTIRNIENIRKYKYLKNGAMYSIFALGAIMLLDSFGMHIPSWISPVATFSVVGYFYFRSFREIKKQNCLQNS